MMNSRRAQYVMGFAPIVMSLIALGIVAEGLVEFGSQRPVDEGWQAHIFQILMVLELPLIVLFVVNNWRTMRRSLPMLGAQVLLWLIAVGSVRFFSL